MTIAVFTNFSYIFSYAVSISSGEIPASNFHVILKTNAICEQCDAFTNYQTLDAQESERFCPKVKAPTNSDELYFEVSISYDAIIYRSSSSTYICELIEEKENMNNYKCNLQK